MHGLVQLMLYRVLKAGVLAMTEVLRRMGKIWYSYNAIAPDLPLQRSMGQIDAR
jgi:hypothetical protein